MPKGVRRGSTVAIGEYELRGASVAHTRDLFMLRIATDRPDVVSELTLLDADDRASIKIWADKWHIAEPWAIDIVERTLRNWRVSAPDAKHREWASADDSAHWMPRPAALTWSPVLQTEAAFDDAIRKYKDEVRRWATSAGLERPASKPHLDRDLGALVHYQVSGADWEAVTQRWFVEPSGENSREKARPTRIEVRCASMALRSLTRLIGLPLRN